MCTELPWLPSISTTASYCETRTIKPDSSPITYQELSNDNKKTRHNVTQTKLFGLKLKNKDSESCVKIVIFYSKCQNGLILGPY